MEHTKPVFTKNREFKYRNETIRTAIFEISEGQYSTARTRIGNFTTEIVFTIEKLIIEILIEGMKPAVMGEKKRLNSKVEKNF